jgi:spore coat polysaccharide biosynthesis predicted glycosyltransferase SpsG
VGIVYSRRGLLNAKTAVFRLDSVSVAGINHFMRCRALALEMLRRNWVVFFVGEEFPEDCYQLKTVFSELNFIAFESDTDSMKDTKKFIQLLNSGIFGAINVVIVDSNRFRREDYAVLQLFSNRTTIAVIDDLAQFDTPAQVVINPHPGFSSEPYHRQIIPCILCGAEFCLLTPEVAVMKERKYDEAGPVLIDVGNSVELITKILDSMQNFVEKDIVVILDKPEAKEKLESICDNRPDKPGFLLPDAQERAYIFSRASLAITDTGNSLWDVYCLGIPSICMLWADQNISTFELFKDQASGLLVDLFSNINLELKSATIETGLKKVVETFGSPGSATKKFDSGFRVAELIKNQKTSIAIEVGQGIDMRLMKKAISRLSSGCQFVHEMVQNQKCLIDGLGTIRVVDAFENLQWQSVPLFNADYWRAYEDW